MKVFYTTVRATIDGHLHAEVKGTKIVVDDEVWEKVAGLTCAGIRKFDEHAKGYTRIGTYKEMLLDPTAQIRNRLGVGCLTSKDRMISYLITYILTPRERNHAQVTDKDLQLVHSLKTCQKMNWPLIIAENIMKSRRLVDYKLPYVLLISKIIRINTDDEVTNITSARRNSYITKKHVEKLGMKKIGDRWLMIGEGPELDDDEVKTALAPC